MLYSPRETIFMNTGFQKISGWEVATKNILPQILSFVRPSPVEGMVLFLREPGQCQPTFKKFSSQFEQIYYLLRFKLEILISK